MESPKISPFETARDNLFDRESGPEYKYGVLQGGATSAGEIFTRFRHINFNRSDCERPQSSTKTSRTAFACAGDCVTIRLSFNFFPQHGFRRHRNSLSDEFAVRSIAKRVETVTHVAVIIVAVLLGAALVKRFFLPHAHDRAAAPQVEAGTRLSLPGVEWPKGQRTMLLVLSTNCRFCTESAPLYRRLSEERARRGGVRIVAVFPQSVSSARKYLSDIGVAVNEVNQVSPSSLGIGGTPTLILVDDSGTVQRIWVGRLSPAKEAELFNQLRGEG